MPEKKHEAHPKRMSPKMKTPMPIQLALPRNLRNRRIELSTIANATMNSPNASTKSALKELMNWSIHAVISANANTFTMKVKNGFIAYFTALNDMSSPFTECVSAPNEM